jgi:hypothetical protein
MDQRDIRSRAKCRTKNKILQKSKQKTNEMRDDKDHRTQNIGIVESNNNNKNNNNNKKTLMYLCANITAKKPITMFA